MWRVMHDSAIDRRTFGGMASTSTDSPSNPFDRLSVFLVGRVGSACLSPAHGAIALAIVRREAEPGTVLTVGEDGVTAEVVALPFG